MAGSQPALPFPEFCGDRQACIIPVYFDLGEVALGASRLRGERVWGCLSRDERSLGWRLLRVRPLAQALIHSFRAASPPVFRISDLEEERREAPEAGDTPRDHREGEGERGDTSGQALGEGDSRSRSQLWWVKGGALGWPLLS